MYHLTPPRSDVNYDLLRYERLNPGWVKVGYEDKKQFPTDLIHAWHMPYIALDSTKAINTIIIDVDGGDAVHAWENSFPDTFRPAYMAGKTKGDKIIRPHVVIHLKRPVWRSDKKQMAFWRVIKEEISLRLQMAGCDVDGCQPNITKNPCSNPWTAKTWGDHFERKEWELTELAHLLQTYRNDIHFYNDSIKKRAKQKRKAKRAKGVYGGRNDLMFNTLRHHGYSLATRNMDVYEGVKAEGQRLNHELFAGYVLDEKELDDICKSIARYCASNPIYEPTDQKNRGAAEDYIKPADTLKERQRKGALYSASKNANKKVQALRDALKTFEGIPSKKALSRAAGVSLNTTKKYWDDVINGNSITISAGETLENYRDKQTVLPFPDMTIKGGQNGVHQERRDIVPVAAETEREANTETETVEYPQPRQTPWVSVKGLYGSTGETLDCMRVVKGDDGETVKEWITVNVDDIPY